MRPPFDEFYDDEGPPQTRINSLLMIATALAMVGLGLVMRSNALNATELFEDRINGIQGQLPANWLLDTNSDEYVFRAEDAGGIPFKTLIQVSILTVGPDARPNNVVDALGLQGPEQLSTYTVLSRKATMLGEDDAIEISYVYVETESNPFLESEPIVVRGIDLVVKRGNQAIVFTFRDASETFDDNRFYFENFLQTVEYQ